MAMPRVEFFFDYLSPWSYLAFVRVREAAMRTSADILWKPLDVHRVFAAVGRQDGPNPQGVSPAKERYRKQDLANWAEFCGVVIQQRSRPPCAAEHALCVAAAFGDGRLVAAFSEIVFDSYFDQGEDIGDVTVIRRILASLRLDPQSIDRLLLSPEALNAVERNADELVRRGGFGVPTMFVGDRMFFGNDRLPLVELALTRMAERPFVAPGAHGQVS